ncbi:uncharacterized protein LOC114383567 [Glycine soja]|nr:uncharacterized protein LOC114383567 [Glycine soja]
MYRNRKGHAIIAPVGQLLEDFKICSISPTERILKREETDYDLNQEPQSSALLLSDDVSNEEENFADLSFSFSTPLMSIIQRENSKEIMRFSSSTAAANHSVDSSSTPSFANNYINLDLTI